MDKYHSDIEKKYISADCVGLGKGYIWTNGGEGVIEAIGNDKTWKRVYRGNGCPDKSANGMLEYAKKNGLKHGKIDTIPEVPGLAVYKPGHVGYYIGGGEVVEARGFKYGIVKTKLKDRGFVEWAEFPGIDYLFGEGCGEGGKTVKKEEPKSEEVLYENNPTLRKGAKGDYVTLLQELLISNGYELGTYGKQKNGVDGDFGKKTDVAVRAFQKDNELKVDGIVGKKTWSKLGESAVG